MDDLRMDAYYYGFDKTGVEEIDLILSAVACAGKWSHHTDSWDDMFYESDGYYKPHKGNSPVDCIQNAANKAAEKFKELI